MPSIYIDNLSMTKVTALRLKVKDAILQNLVW